MKFNDVWYSYEVISLDYMIGYQNNSLSYAHQGDMLYCLSASEAKVSPGAFFFIKPASGLGHG